MTSTDQCQSVAHDDYPGLFQAADAASVQRQRSYRKVVLSRLVLTVAAAAFGAVQLDGLNWLALGTAVAFVGVMALELGEATSRPDKSWYTTRALSESVKTLTWRYIAGAEPFPSTSDSADCDFVERISALQQDMPDVPLPGTTPTITDKMRAVRAAPLAERKQAYLTGRVIDQQNWYANKALHHQRQARILRTLMLVLEVVGIVGALLTAFAGIPVDLAGFVAAGVFRPRRVELHAPERCDRHGLRAGVPRAQPDSRAARPRARRAAVVGRGERGGDDHQPRTHHVARPPQHLNLAQPAGKVAVRASR